MRIELTDEQRRTVEEQAGRPVEVVDPNTNRTYMLIAREEYDRLSPLLQTESTPVPSPPNLPTVPPGIRRSQEALRRALPGLLEVPRLRGQWVAYHGDERIGIARSKTTLMRACLKRGLDDDEFYIGIIQPYGLIEEEELDPPSPSHMMDAEEDIRP